MAENNTTAINQPAYMEMVNFIASGPSTHTVAAYHPSPAAQLRASELLEKDKTSSLSETERAELDGYVELEHLMRMAKARAREILAGMD